MSTYRFRGGGYRRGGMSTMGLAFPPFTPAVKWIVIINAAIYLLMLLLGGLLPELARLILRWLLLTPSDVVHGGLWQLVTYAFFHAGLFHVLFNMLAVWMFGSQLELDFGRKQFYEFYFFSLIGAALTTVAIGYIGIGLVQLYAGSQPPGLFHILQSIAYTRTLGASGAVYGILMAYALLHGDNQIMLFPIPFTIRAKYMVAIWGFIALAGAISNVGGVANFAHLGGLLFGFMYVRMLPRRGLGFAASEGYFSMRNAWYRWKRRRAARKFEVYMRKHNRADYFDEYGNFRDPEDPKKGDGEGRPPWVN